MEIGINLGITNMMKKKVLLMLILVMMNSMGFMMNKVFRSIKLFQFFFIHDGLLN